MITPMQVFFVGVIPMLVFVWFMYTIATSLPKGMEMPRQGFTRWHWNDERQIAKLRHPSARADVYECWDPKCDCHLGKSLPYDWEFDSDLTSDRPVGYYS